ncbi:MAG TPA: protein kinase [Vicinamibacterales bacterium]|nr:protein kinase [Vicinamibacterales bacterium]
MKHTPGTRLGPYEVIAPIGAGGMGEVYRARDTRLNRDVAIKVLPEMFALDAERIARFEREAQVLASLNHPHIAQVHGVIDAPPALVMEFVGGEDLAARLRRGPIPVPEALALAAQIAEALAAAHDRGIVHRDLKPANVKVTDDGVVKVLDFGLAKALETPAAPGAALMDSPTITSPAAMTRMGVILGTAAYMSPEQARGKTVDRSADLWAFGALLYELLTGKAAFEGETVTDVLAAIVTRDPDWSALPADTPPGVVRLLRRCLNRDRRGRLADAGEARFQIEEALAAPAAGTGVDDSARRPSRAMALAPWGVAAVLAIALIAALWPRPAAPRPAMTHVSIEAPPRAVVSTVLRPSLSISSDGNAIAFIATSSGVDRLYVRAGDQFEARLLDGTEGASNPAISPDGRWVAFSTASKVYKIPVTGGAKIEIATVNDPRGVSWDTDAALLITPNWVGGIVRVPANGGASSVVTSPVTEKERTHRWPQALPGGKAVLFTVGDFDNPDNYFNARIDLHVIATGERKTLINGAEMARYSPTGHLVYGRDGSLFAVPFDAQRLEVGAASERLIQGVSGDNTSGAVHFDLSPAGTLAYVASGGNQTSTRLAWVDRTGRVEYLDVPAGAYADPAISPDGRRVAVSVIAGGGRDIWIYSLERRTFTRATFGGQNATPLWSADGAWIYYVSLDPSGSSATIWRRAADGSRDAESLVNLPHLLYLNSISRDGRVAFFDHSHAATRESDIGYVALEKEAAERPLISTPAPEYLGMLSPDGRWIAYESHESSRAETYVRPADPAASGRWQVSTTGGREPKWSRDGRTLYYRFDNLLLAVDVDAAGAGFQSGVPRQVLTNVYDPRFATGLAYDVHPDGRFIMIRRADEESVSNTIRLIVNWFDELKRIGSGR